MTQGNGKDDNSKRKYTRINRVPKFSFGDLVKIDGYGDDVFQVESYTVEGYRHWESDLCYDAILYDLTRLRDGDFALGEEENMTLLAPCDQADAFIEANVREYGPGKDDEVEGGFNIIFTLGEAQSMANKNPNQPNHRQEEKAEVARRKAYRKRVDELMDEYNRFKALGEEEDVQKVMEHIELLAKNHSEGYRVFSESDID